MARVRLASGAFRGVRGVGGGSPECTATGMSAAKERVDHGGGYLLARVATQSDYHWSTLSLLPSLFCAALLVAQALSLALPIS